MRNNRLALPVGEIENANLDGGLFAGQEIIYTGKELLSAKKTIFSRTNITADFTGGDFKESRFLQVFLDVTEAQEADFSNSLLEFVTFLPDADFTNAKFSRAKIGNLYPQGDINFQGLILQAPDYS